jgi:hypothetical protein
LRNFRSETRVAKLGYWRLGHADLRLSDKSSGLDGRSFDPQAQLQAHVAHAGTSRRPDRQRRALTGRKVQQEVIQHAKIQPHCHFSFPGCKSYDSVSKPGWVGGSLAVPAAPPNTPICGSAPWNHMRAKSSRVLPSSCICGSKEFELRTK